LANSNICLPRVQKLFPLVRTNQKVVRNNGKLAAQLRQDPATSPKTFITKALFDSPGPDKANNEQCRSSVFLFWFI